MHAKCGPKKLPSFACVSPTFAAGAFFTAPCLNGRLPESPAIQDRRLYESAALPPQYPARSLLTIEDVSFATAALATDAARLITGDTIYIDGGYDIMG
jgi:NAD(P)-dependent dehydrogenase (short-subunit alcohol dehydrogenase family)